MRVFVATRWHGCGLTLMLGCAVVQPGCSRVQAPREAPIAAKEEEPLSDSERHARRGAQLQACLAAASEQHPGLALETDAFYVLRGETVTFVDVELPEAPELATCVQRVIRHNPHAGPRVGQSSLAIGLVPLSLGALEKRRHQPLGELRLRAQLSTRRAHASGAIQPYELTLGPAFEWPNAAQRAELEDCYEALRSSHPGLSVHLSVNYLARAERVVLADVQVPQAPALAACSAA